MPAFNLINTLLNLVHTFAKEIFWSATGIPSATHAESVDANEFITPSRGQNITGLTGRRIIDAILSRKRDPQKLASLRD